jgi:GMP synthase (glutamine-hydrolysing)
MGLHLLIVEGNVAADRAAYVAGFGKTASDSYAATLGEIAPDASCEICFPADADAKLPAGAALENFDAVFITGSALNVYDGGAPIERQLEFSRAVFASKTPFFGSCWGLQIACAAAGGWVARNPNGREIGIARSIRPTEAGRAHPLLAGRGESYSALCSHIDHVETLPPGGVALAANAMSKVQAAEIEWGGGRFWGVQYHPEYSFKEVAALIKRRARTLADEKLFADEKRARAYASDLEALDAEPERADLASRLQLAGDVVESNERRRELKNFLDLWVRPTKISRGRA